METATEYLEKTASAAQKLFEGIDSYLEIIRGHEKSFFISGALTPEKMQADFEAWQSNNQEAIQQWMAASERYFSETFAQATLCGAVLQIAFKAIERYSINEAVPEEWTKAVSRDKKSKKFAFGRLVRGVPLGLVVFAGRNQHMHYEDREALRDPTWKVLDTLARNIPGVTSQDIREPGLDVSYPGMESLATNITFALGWRSYAEFYNDMRELLAT